MSGVEVDVKLPSFESEFETNLRDILIEMGIKSAFSGKDADFSEMTETQVCISKVIHKAKIKVDEQGSEAAAVTDVVMGYTGMGPGGPVDFTAEFHADRPFIYAINRRDLLHRPVHWEIVFGLQPEIHLPTGRGFQGLARLTGWESQQKSPRLPRAYAFQ